MGKGGDQTIRGGLPGEEIRLVLGGRWLHPRNPITGQFPAAYEPSPDCTVRVHCDGEPPPRLLVPVIE